MPVQISGLIFWKQNQVLQLPCALLVCHLFLHLKTKSQLILASCIPTAKRTIKIRIYYILLYIQLVCSMEMGHSSFKWNSHAVHGQEWAKLITGHTRELLSSVIEVIKLGNTRSSLPADSVKGKMTLGLLFAFRDLDIKYIQGIQSVTIRSRVNLTGFYDLEQVRNALDCVSRKLSGSWNAVPLVCELSRRL